MYQVLPWPVRVTSSFIYVVSPIIYFGCATHFLQLNSWKVSIFVHIPSMWYCKTKQKTNKETFQYFYFEFMWFLIHLFSHKFCYCANIFWCRNRICVKINVCSILGRMRDWILYTTGPGIGKHFSVRTLRAPLYCNAVFLVLLVYWLDGFENCGSGLHPFFLFY